ncbi:PH domain-containing protein [Thermodesulfovibrio yellowstonii]|uniref:PH domain-containing protein n=1 Tax=Thermodesulfovibrio yellowstonii TaxID=28262 RepID=UPI0003FDE8B0|nr:PH domain-containing protein [Thermodesulfovibrio islandicus]
MKTQLRDDERVLYIAKKHWIVYLLGLAFLGIFSLFKSVWFILIGVGLLIYIHLDRRNNVWIVTNQRFIDEWGVFSVNSKDVPLNRVNNVQWMQDPLGRILGYGTVEVQSAATEGAVVAKLVSHPKKLATVLLQAQVIDTQENLMQCPFCKELIRKDAVKCKHCGSILVPENRMEQTPQEKQETFQLQQSVVEKKEEENSLDKENEEEKLFERRGEVWRPKRF